MKKQYKSMISFLLTVLLVFTMIVPTVIAEGIVTPSASDVDIVPTSMSDGGITTTSEEGSILTSDEEIMTTSGDEKPGEGTNSTLGEETITTSGNGISTSDDEMTPTPEDETISASGDEKNDVESKQPDSQPEELDFNIITSIMLNDEHNIDLTSKESIKKDSKVFLEFKYAIPEGKFVYKGDTFTFKLPDELKSLEGQFELEGDGGKISYGTGVVSAGEVKITFSENVEKDNVTGSFFFAAQFVEEKIGDENPVPIIFDIKGESTVIALDFEQKQKVNPSISKESIAFDKQTNIITWKVHIKSGDEDIKNVVFNDSIQEDQEYVAGSFKVGTASIDDANVLGKDGKTLNYTFDSIAKESTKVITFKTKIKDNQLPAEDKTKTYKNKASIQPDGYADPIESNEAGVTVLTDILQKTGEPTKSSSGATTIDWTITINEHLQTIKNQDGSLKIEDTLQEGLKLVQDSVKIWDGDQDVTTSLGNLETSDTRFTFTFKDTISEKYTITYTTEVTDQNFLITGVKENFTNTAVLTGTAVVDGSATVTTGVGVSPNRISKSGTYDRSSKEITWTISINNDGVPLKNVKLTDTIAEGQTFVQGSLSPNNVCTYDEASKTIECNLGDINENQIITFKTIVDSNHHNATNNQSTYYNTATLTHDNITDSTGEVPVQVTSNVIKKAVAESYNYEDRTITWKLTVNENKMSLTNIVVKDTIPDEFEYVEGSAKTSIDNIGTFSNEGKTLIFNANKDQVIKDQFDITFKTKVSNPDEFFKTNGKINVTNTATIEADEIPGTVTSNEASTVIQNNIVSKKGDFNKGAKSITWQVEVNPNHITIPAGATIKDTLQEGLELDIDSVKLYSATVDPKTGALMKGAEVELEDGNIQYDGKTRQFDFTFPAKATSVPSAYILVFDTDVMKEGTYSNSVTFNGTGSDLTGQSNNYVIDKASMGGTGAGNTKTIKIEKVDKDTKEKLSGAEFELWMEHPRLGEETFVRTVSSDSKGQVSFDRLRSGIKYIVKEVKAPEGYQLNSTPLEFTLDSKEKHPNETTPYLFENERIKGAVQFMKKGKDGQPLSGAEFKLYYKADTAFELPVGQAISDQNGMVTFENVPLGEYVIKETKAPTGYNLSEQVLNVKVTKESAQGVTQAQPYEMMNERTKGSIQFIKTNELGNPLAGAEFELFAEDNSKVGSTVTSNEDGLVDFKDVEHGVYTIKESKAPKGYQILSKPLKVTVDGKEGEIYKLEDVKNYKIVIPPPMPAQGDVKVQKTDENGTPLAGAEFTLYASDGKEVARSVSDATGIVMFKSIPFGNYTLKETKAPSGYIKSDEILYVTIKDSAVYEFTFVNKKEDNTTNPGTDP
ncbi:SpaA isopeptide-forming pilin-related protein, partial [Bacillus sp. JJ722]|uniref:SpaA isopeptide-forming pilin-related protein n=1 Tax=Bacillus sp. JJ722 TaxID=3122973 RepID=UPI002FFF3C34